MKDKIIGSGVDSIDLLNIAPVNTQVNEEAVSALTMLGFVQTQSQKVVTAILKEEPDAPVEKVIKLALKRL